MKNSVFVPADILIPKNTDERKWSVIACDQFSSQRSYWQEVEQAVGDAPSTLRLILPEAYLGDTDSKQRAAEIDDTMVEYLESGLFRKVENSFVYVERTVSGGVRRGLVGALDLEQYNYEPGSGAAIRASEKTVVSRLPARVSVRRRAAIELPHIMALIDDAEGAVIEPLAEKKGGLEKLYELDLMQQGGHLAGWRVSGAEAALVCGAFEKAFKDKAVKVIIGDGNHSLAAAKTYWDEIKGALSDEQRAIHPARYALVEMNNVYDAAIEFEAIHRVVFGIDPEKLVREFINKVPQAGAIEYSVQWSYGDKTGAAAVAADSIGMLIGAVQETLEGYTAENGGDIDYIHGESTARELSREKGAAAFILPSMGKSDFFATVTAGGMFPKKSFSIGHAQEKRYYYECRKIKL